MIYEEKVIGKYDVHALQVVGLEGTWGFLLTTTLLVIFYFIPGKDCGRFEDALEAFVQLYNSWVLLLAIIGSIVSIAFYNFFGISVTKFISAATRTTIDSCRTLFIWIISMAVGWEKFHWLELGGFVVLVLGAFIFNEVLRIPGKWYSKYYVKKTPAEKPAETQPDSKDGKEETTPGEPAYYHQEQQQGDHFYKQDTVRHQPTQGDSINNNYDDQITPKETDPFLKN